MTLLRDICQKVFLPSPAPGTAVMVPAFPARATGPELISFESRLSRSDTVDVASIRFSPDNGATWSDPVRWSCEIHELGGTRRRHPRNVYADPVTGRTLFFFTTGVLPSDEPLEGMRNWTVWYAVSEDGGKTTIVLDQIRHTGDAFDGRNPIPGVRTGANCYMIGDLGCCPITRSDGAILVPFQTSPVDASGRYHSPGGGFTYTDAQIAIGTWRANGTLDWRTGARVCADPARSTRGMIEPTIAQLPGGDLIMVMRGSNDRRPELPAHRWFSRSADGGLTWSVPEPWTYEDGTAFHSPSSMSQLLPHSSGRLFWCGNICEKNASGNGPRYPIVLAEVDRTSGTLIRESVSAIDDLRPGESPMLTLSNFHLREDRMDASKLHLHMTRLFAHQQPGTPLDWTADATITTLTLAN